MVWCWNPAAPPVFISGHGNSLGWRRAFPDARLLPPGVSDQARLVWLRLAGGDLRPQLDAAGLLEATAPWVALSDRPGDDEAALVLEFNARGYCNSHADESILTQVAHVVELGGLWLSPGLMQRLVRSTAAAVASTRPSPAPGIEQRLALLTGRETAVALRAARGASNKEIGRELGITERTVKMHMTAVLEKLALRDRLHLALAMRGATAPTDRADR